MGARHRNRKSRRSRTGFRGDWIIGLVGLVAFVGSIYWFGIREKEPSTRVDAAQQSFGPTIENHRPAPGPAPDGMVWIPGGEFSMGANDPSDMDDVGMKATLDARPIHRAYGDGFYIDRTDVTNAEFGKFVKATGYVTVAERKPRAEDYPTARTENLLAGSVVFAPPDHPVPLNNHLQWWTYIPGANLAASAWPAKQHQGQGQSSGRLDRL